MAEHRECDQAERYTRPTTCIVTRLGLVDHRQWLDQDNWEQGKYVGPLAEGAPEPERGLLPSQS